MKTTTLGMFAALGMVFAGGAVYGVTPDGGFGQKTSAQREVASTEDTSSPIGQGIDTEQKSLSHFTAGQTVSIDGRVGNATALAGSPDDTFLMLQLEGDAKAGGAAPNVALSLVIDKSGSMRGTRLQNAVAAAVSAVDRLREGDSVSIVAFDTRVETVVPITTVTTSNRGSVIAAIRNIQLGGDTCVSCGIEEGLNELRRAPGSAQGTVMRMLVLSDGDANNGIRDVAGFRNLAQRAQSQGVSITTIGVDLEYNEKILAAIAAGSNGRHYFVESDRDLPRVFESEAATLTDSVASNAVAEIDLAPGVELVQVFDRSFGRSGSKISVPLGSFSKGEQKTVLVKVRVPRGEPGDVTLASVRLSYRDLAAGKDVDADGKLGLELVDDKAKVADIDAVVLDRVQRSETAAALRDANTLFGLGKNEEAQKRLDSQAQILSSARAKAKKDTNDPFAANVDKSFDRQEAELSRASGGFATPPAGAAPAPRKAESNVKKNAEVSNAFGL
ncbi:MAG TPA: VWA domain-containing protein [Polyangiaceae bacterium]|jgi:Ca-activated chloride channel family protein|nr:VWA domain-containing protein [Polyangiaceae bacterium]